MDDGRYMISISGSTKKTDFSFIYDLSCLQTCAIWEDKLLKIQDAFETCGITLEQKTFTLPLLH